jgi:hypothetical protein
MTPPSGSVSPTTQDLVILHRRRISSSCSQPSGFLSRRVVANVSQVPMGSPKGSNAAVSPGSGRILDWTDWELQGGSITCM